MGDLLFNAQSRTWLQAASERDVKTYGYLFNQPDSPPLALPPFAYDPASQAYLGGKNQFISNLRPSNQTQPVPHTAEIPYVFNGIGGTSAAGNLSTHMVDYWVSFATSLDPNDGLGSDRMFPFLPLEPEFN